MLSCVVCSSGVDQCHLEKYGVQYSLIVEVGTLRDRVWFVSFCYKRNGHDMFLHLSSIYHQIPPYLLALSSKEKDEKRKKRHKSYNLTVSLVCCFIPSERGETKKERKVISNHCPHTGLNRGPRHI